MSGSDVSVSEKAGARGGRLFAALRRLAPEQRRAALLAAGRRDVFGCDEHWALWAHPGQEPPGGEWTVWVMMAGRGFGKTRAGSEWVSARAREMPGAKIALVAANPEEARRVMVEGRAGLMAAARDGEERRRMRWEPGLGRLTFASGAEAFVFSGADGESLRGAEHHFAWCDELAKWRRADAAWDNLMMGLRAGARPRAVVTTTPKTVQALQRIIGTEGVVLTGGASRDNPHNPPAFLQWVERTYGGTRLGRQELEGELLVDVKGALWARELIERCRAAAGPAREDLKRVVVGVDPPVSADGDACGIVVCGVAADGVGWVLADHSEAGLSPEGWARRVAHAAEVWRADRVVAEGNQGGDMVEAVLRGAGLKLGVSVVHARVGKVRRAEPVAAFFERGEARIAGAFPALEDQMAGLAIGGGYGGPGRSPDRADAMVWAMTALLEAPADKAPRVRAL
ncbi:MAG TPA: terminase family protein [Allosphingosinicella sp.]